MSHTSASSDPTGLSTAEARERLVRFGPNAADTEPPRTLMGRLLDMAREPMFMLLVAAAVLYIVLGDIVEGLTLSLFVLAVLGMTFWQEGRADAALQALRGLTQPQARVLRDGQIQRIAATEVVPDDLLLLAEGDRIAADGWLLQAEHLQVDESLLTGESVPVGKRAVPELPPEPMAPGGDDTPAVFAGCHVVRGQGLAQVTATGTRSQVGQIGAALAQAHEPPSPLQQQTAALVRKLAWGVAVLCLVMVLTLGLRHGDWLAALLSACDLFVHPGAHETFGLVVLEAMACGLPVLGVRAGGVGELVDDDVGCLVDDGSVDALCEGLLRLAASNLKQLGRQARKRACLRHDWHCVLPQLVAHYRQLAGADAWPVQASLATG